MNYNGLCITTGNARRLAEFYKIIFQEEPLVEGSRYGFNIISIWNLGELKTKKNKKIWLQLFTSNVEGLYERVLRDIPDIQIISPLERKPWGEYSFWFSDPDGNKIAFAQI